MLSGQQLLRYSRQYIINGIGAEGQKKIMNGRVLVIGAGALGSPAMMYLAGAGIGTIGIADFDRVDLSNLQRQIIHDTDSVGEKKTVSARATINRLNPDVNVITHDFKIDGNNIVSVISDYDIVIDASDRLVTKMMINDACIMAGRPLVHAGAERFFGQITTILPDRGPCLRCLLEDNLEEEEEGACARYGILGPVTGILGSIQALEVIKYLTGTGELLTGRILYLDGLAMEFDTVEFSRNENCPACGKFRKEDLMEVYRQMGDNRCG